MQNTLKKIDRDENGLIIGIDYIFDENGLVSWKDMVSPMFLYVNPDPKKRKKIEEKYKKAYSEIIPSVDKVDDQDLIIMLGGLKQLLRLRGFEKVCYNIKESNENYAAVSCSIVFSPTFESEFKSQEYTENACAHPANTMSFAQNYLLEIATNRALARCIRNYLNINIVSKEELSAASSTEEESKIIAPNPHPILEKMLIERKIDINELKKLVKQPDATWTNINDISRVQAFSIIGFLKQSN